MDGSTEAAWSRDAQFASPPRTTRCSHRTATTPFPRAEPPPCGDCGTVISSTAPIADLVFSSNLDLAVARFDVPRDRERVGAERSTSSPSWVVTRSRATTRDEATSRRARSMRDRSPRLRRDLDVQAQTDPWARSGTTRCSTSRTSTRSTRSLRETSARDHGDQFVNSAIGSVPSSIDDDHGRRCWRIAVGVDDFRSSRLLPDDAPARVRLRGRRLGESHVEGAVTLRPDRPGSSSATSNEWALSTGRGRPPTSGLAAVEIVATFSKGAHYDL